MVMIPQLYPYQLQGVEFLTSTPRALLADEMGLGKTVQAIIALRTVSPILVVCPASIIGVWEREFSKWDSTRQVTSLIGPLPQRRQTLLSKGLDVVLVNYEVVAKLLPDLQRVRWGALALDEAHRVKNRRAQVTKAVQSLSRSIPRIIELTGTPILNRPDDLWALLNVLSPSQFRSYWKFVERYCSVFWNGFGWEVGGPRDPEGLAQALAPFYLRREKTEVMKDLPEKIVSQVWVPLEGTQRREYSEMKRTLTALLDSGERVSALAVVSQLLRLRQICVDPNILVDGGSEPLSGAKARALLDLLEGRDGGKVVIFSQWSRAVRAAYSLLEERGIPTLIMTGDTPQLVRAMIVDQFQTDPYIKVLALTIGVGGLGLTLTAADTAIFLDKSWTPALNTQAQDRLHRVGQTSTVWVYEILAQETVEEYVEDLLSRKVSWSASILTREVLTAREF